MSGDRSDFEESRWIDWPMVVAYGIAAAVSAYLIACSYKASTRKSTDALMSVVGCSDPCVVKDNGGGVVSQFQKAAFLVHERHQPVKIDGVCASACAIFADEARPYVCITPRAQFAFHQAKILSEGKIIGRFDPPHSKDVVGWVRKHGGFPADDLLVMKYHDAKNFWPTCTS